MDLIVGLHPLFLLQTQMMSWEHSGCCLNMSVILVVLRSFVN